MPDIRTQFVKINTQLLSGNLPASLMVDIKSDKEPIDSIASAIMLGSWLRSGEGALLS